MNPIKVRFAYDGALRDRDSTTTAKLINDIIFSAFDGRHHSGVPYHKSAIDLISKQTAEIKRRLLQDNTFFQFVEAIHDPFEIKPKEMYLLNDVIEYNWEMKFHLQSDIFTCIEILPGKIVVCYQKDKEVQFIPLNSLKMILAE